jgi:hypothetical protein
MSTEMSLYHGTSAASALKILQSGETKPSTDGYFYCFDSARPESLAGAICFATGDGPRRGALTQKNFFSKYAQLNPAFPKGLKGVFAKAALKMAARAWTKDQLKAAQGPLDYKGAILVYPDQPSAQPRSRAGFVNEVKVPAAALRGLKPECVYIDDSLLDSAEVAKLSGTGIAVKPLSECAGKVIQDCAALKAKGRHFGPKPL